MSSTPVTESVAFFRRAFLRHQPKRYAVMQPETADRKYDDFHGRLTDAQVTAHLAGQTTYAVPYAEGGLGSVLAFDIDAGGTEALHALMWNAAARGLFAFGQHDPVRDRGYVWIPFAELTNMSRLHALGEQLRVAVHQEGWHVENRASEADTRLPLARHRWSGVFGNLYLPDAPPLVIDADPTGALGAFITVYRENSVEALPPPPQATPARSQHTVTQPSYPGGITIQAYNAATDLVTLLESYGAKRARGQGARLYFCPFHDDKRASLILNRDGTHCHCYSTTSHCPLADHQYDAFSIFCIGESLDTTRALRRLNGLPEDAKRPEDRRRKTEDRRSSQDGSRPSLQRTPLERPAEDQQRLSEEPQATTSTPPETEPSHSSTPETPPSSNLPCPSSGRAAFLPKAARKVLAILAEHPQGYCRGKYHLAELLDLDTRTVQRSLRRLENEGHITRVQRGREGQTDIYRVVQMGEGRGQDSGNREDVVSYDTTHTDQGAANRVDPIPPLIPNPYTLTPDCLLKGRHLPSTEDSESLPEESLLETGRGGGCLPPVVATADGAYHGPAGAVAYPGGAAYVPSEAVSWYTELPVASPAEPSTETPAIWQAFLQETPHEPSPPAAVPVSRTPRRTVAPADQGKLLSRIIAAERKAEKLEAERNPKARAQARAIRREVGRLKGQLAVRQAQGYSIEECERWFAERAPGGSPEQPDAPDTGAAITPPYPSSGQYIPARGYDLPGLVARLRERQHVGERHGTAD